MTLLHKGNYSTLKLRFALSKIFVAALCGLVTLCYAGVSFRSFSLMDGWSYFPLSSNLDAYEEYYYPVTPLTVWEAKIASHFPDPLIALRLMLLPLIPVYFFSLFVLTKRISGIYTAAMLSAIGTLAPGVLGLEPLAGWNSQSWIFLGIGASLFVTSILTKDFRGLWYSSLAGFVFSLAILSKQTSVVPVALIIIGSILLGRFISNAKGTSKAGISALMSLLISLGLSFLLILASGMFPAILSQTLSSGGKALDPLKTLNDVMIVFSETILQPAFIFVVVWLIVLLMWNLRSVSPTLLKPTLLPSFTYEFLLIFGLILIAFYILNPQLFPQYSSYIVLYAILSFWILRVLERIHNANESSMEYYPVLFLALGTPLLLGIALFQSDVPSFFIQLSILDYISLTLGIFIQLSFIIFALLTLVKGSVLREPLEKWSKTVGDVFWSIVITCLMGLGSSINFLSSGGDALWVWYSLPIIVCVAFVMNFLSRLPNLRNARVFAFSIISLALIHYVFVITITPYSWWGWSDDSILESDRRDPRLNYLTGVSLSASASDFYTRVATSVDRAASLSLDDEPSVFTFPNIPATATVTEHQPYRGLNCWVQWYDVCPPSLSLEDLHKFKEYPSAVIIWRDIVENEATIHEDVFRQSYSPLRLWQIHKDQEVDSGRWIKVDSISGSEFDNLWSDIGVYYRLPVAQWSTFMKIDWIQKYGSLPKF